MSQLVFKHPLWVAILGWSVLPFMLLGSLWLIALPIIYQNFELLTFLPPIVLGLPCAYMSYHAILSLPFMAATIEANEDGLLISQKDKQTFVNWSDISKVRHVASVQVVHLYNSNNERIASFTEQLKGYPMLAELLNQRANGTL